MFKRLVKGLSRWWTRMRTPHVEQSKPEPKCPPSSWEPEEPPPWKPADLNPSAYCLELSYGAEKLLEESEFPFSREDYKDVIFEPNDKRPALLEVMPGLPHCNYTRYLVEVCGWDRGLAETTGKRMRAAAIMKRDLKQLEDIEKEMEKMGYEPGWKTSRLPNWKAPG